MAYYVTFYINPFTNEFVKENFHIGRRNINALKDQGVKHISVYDYHYVGINYIERKIEEMKSLLDKPINKV